jgi:hypothetical protein
MEIAQIHQKIYEIRGFKVMLDFDLAELYEIETKYLKRSVRNNFDRFPNDFLFELSKEEFENLRCNISTSNHGGIRYLPFAFTEQGVSMLSSVLKSKKAIDVNIAIMRTFVQIRQFALSHVELSVQLKQLEQKYDKQFDDIFEVINYLLKKDSLEKQTKERGKIGYKKE